MAQITCSVFETGRARLAALGFHPEHIFWIINENLMRYFPQHNLFFVHIPKCAGISVARALDEKSLANFEAMADDFGLDVSTYAQIRTSAYDFEHRNLGTIHLAHVPLPVLAVEMPKTWNILNSTNAFALIRPYRARFISALLQRLKEFKDAGAIGVEDPLVTNEADRVCEWLEGRSYFADMEYIHFARQSDFVEKDGKRIVKNVFPVDRTDCLTQWIASVTDLEIEIHHDHVRRQPKGWANKIQPAARFAARKLMPQIVKKKLYPLWLGSPAFVSSASKYDTIRFSDAVERFLPEYYAIDVALHAEAVKNAAKYSAQKVDA